MLMFTSYNPVCINVYVHSIWTCLHACVYCVFSGIGLALCERLLSQDAQLQLCLACRNMQRAEAARQALLVSHPQAQVTLLHLDVGNMHSVLRAAEEFKQK